MQLLRSPTAVERDPAIDAWFDSRAGKLGTIAHPWRCAHLPDPAGLLEGTGKNMRHVKLRPGEVINREALATLIQAAYSTVKSAQRV